MEGGEGTECLDVVLGDLSAGRVVRPLAGQEGTVPDPEGGVGVKGETPAQVIDRVEAAVLDAGADLQCMEEPLDPPAQFVSAQHRAGGVKGGPAPGGQQHPVQRFVRFPLLRCRQRRATGRVLLKGRDGDHANRWFILPVLRRKQVHRRAA